MKYCFYYNCITLNIQYRQLENMLIANAKVDILVDITLIDSYENDQKNFSTLYTNCTLKNQNKRILN